MADESMAVKVAEHGKEIGSLKHRVTEVELEIKVINNLALSVERLAINMQQMLREQEKQGERLDKLEAAPGEQWSSMKRTIFNTIVGAGAGAFATGIIYMMAQFIK